MRAGRAHQVIVLAIEHSLAEFIRVRGAPARTTRHAFE